jgi:hypothetical protein
VFSPCVRLDEVQNEIFKLENNIQFLPILVMLREFNCGFVVQNIAIQYKESLDVWKRKLKH